MSVWPSASVTASSLALCGSEGELLCAAICVAPRRLEDLLEALARSQYPINPQIYHDGVLQYHYADGHEEIEPATVIEFPVYPEWLSEIRALLAERDFSRDALHVTGMLEELHSTGAVSASAPPGAPWRTVTIRKCPLRAAAGTH